MRQLTALIRAPSTARAENLYSFTESKPSLCTVRRFLINAYLILQVHWPCAVYSWSLCRWTTCRIIAQLGYCLRSVATAVLIKLISLPGLTARSKKDTRAVIVFLPVIVTRQQKVSVDSTECEVQRLNGRDVRIHHGWVKKKKSIQIRDNSHWMK